MQRARTGAEQLLSAAGHGDPAIAKAVDAIVESAQAGAPSRPGGQAASAPTPVAEPTAPERAPAEPEPEPEAPAAESTDSDDDEPQAS